MAESQSVYDLLLDVLILRLYTRRLCDGGYRAAVGRVEDEVLMHTCVVFILSELIQQAFVKVSLSSSTQQVL